jgi:hypothetical protein
LCSFSSQALQQLVAEIRLLPGTVVGNSAFEINNNALRAVAEASVPFCLQYFGGACPPPAPTQARGDACTSATQCSSGYCVDGVCCDASACPAGARCDVSDSKGTCTLRRSLGDPCGTDTDCASDNCVYDPSPHCGLPSPPPTATPVPSLASLEVTTATARAGTRVRVAVFLRAPGWQVAATQNDLHFDPLNTPVTARRDGRPACTVNPEISKPATTFAFRPYGCHGADCTSIRALVLATDNVDPIMDGSALYVCDIDVATGAQGGYPLAFTGVILANPDGDQIPNAQGIDGEVIVY